MKARGFKNGIRRKIDFGSNTYGVSSLDHPDLGATRNSSAMCSLPAESLDPFHVLLIL